MTNTSRPVSMLASPHTTALIGAGLTFALLLVVWWQAGRWYQARLITEQRAGMAARLSPYTNALSVAVNRRLALLQGLQAYVDAHWQDEDELGQAAFGAFTRGLYISMPGIHSFAVSPGGITRFVYPTAGNQALLGRDLNSDPSAAVRADADRAIATRRMTTSGPDTDGSGDQELIGQLAVYHDDTYWGLVSIAVDLPPVLAEAGLNAVPADLQLTLVDAQGKPFYGSTELLTMNPVIQDINLPDGMWQLAAGPTGGWAAKATHAVRIFDVQAFAIALLLSFLVYFTINRRARLAQKVAAATTGLKADMSRREQAETALRRSENILRKMMDALPVGIWLADRDGTLISGNPAGRRIWEGGRLVGIESYGEYRAWRAGSTTPIAAEDWAVARAVRDGTTSLNELLEIECFDGTHKMVLNSGIPLRDVGGTIIGAIAVNEDITERLAMERALRESEERYRTLARNFPNGAVFLFDRALRYIVADGQGLAAASLTREAIEGQTIWEALPSELAALVEPGHQAALAGHATVQELTYQNMNFEARTAPVFDEQGTVVGGVMMTQDITVRKRAEEAIERYSRRLAALHTVDQGILAAQSSQEIAVAALSQIESLISCEHASIVLFDEPADEARVLAVRAHRPTAISAGRAWPLAEYPDYARLRAGEITPLPNMTALAAPPPLAQMLLAEGVLAILAVPLLAEGQGLGVLNLGRGQIGPFAPEDIEVAREVADQLAVALRQAQLRATLAEHAAQLETRVTERTAQLAQREAALSAANESLRAAADRLKELDQMKSQFVSNVSHELRTPLSNIKLYLSLLERGKPDKHAQYMATLERETLLLQKLIEDLLDLSRLDLGRVQPNLRRIDVNRIIRTLADDRAALLGGRGLALAVNTTPDLPPANADPMMLTQVLTNLMTNAMNYTQAGGQIALRTAACREEDTLWITISVADTGPGINAQDRAHLFERFYRGEAGRASGAPGTGLGLAICHEIIRRHAGRITLESEPGQGTTFTVWLPSAVSAD